MIGGTLIGRACLVAGLLLLAADIEATIKNHDHNSPVYAILTIMSFAGYILL